MQSNRNHLSYQGISADDATAALRSDGYYVARSLVLSECTEALEAQLGEHFDHCPKSEGLFYGLRTKRFSGVFGRATTSHELAINPTILSVIDKLLGPYCDRVQINLTQAISILPGERAQVPHKDDEAFPWPHPGSEFMVNVMWPLTPFTAENGATRIWPGTHLRRVTQPDELEEPVIAAADPGDAIIWTGSVMHGGGANNTDEPRAGLVISYSLGWLRQAENHYLTYSREQIASFPRRLQELLGYVAHRPNLGWVEGNEPLEVINGDGSQLPAQDLFPEETKKRLNAALASVASFIFLCATWLTVGETAALGEEAQKRPTKESVRQLLIKEIRDSGRDCARIRVIRQFPISGAYFVSCTDFLLPYKVYVTKMGYQVKVHID